MNKVFFLVIFLLFFFDLKSQTSSIADNRIRKVVEVLPYFDSDNCADLLGEKKLKCAKEAMLELIYSKMNDLEKAKKKKIAGIVTIRFVVEKNGSLSNFQIVKGLEKEYNLAALNAVKKIGKFVPAQLRGQPVRANFDLMLRIDSKK